MKKNDYKKPTMRVVEIQQTLLQSVSNPPGEGGGHTRENRDCWDDSEEW